MADLRWGVQKLHTPKEGNLNALTIFKKSHLVKISAKGEGVKKVKNHVYLRSF